MSTWIDDVKDPELKAAYKLVGNQGNVELRNMVRALESMSMLNTPEDNARLKAAKMILKGRRKKKCKSSQ